MPTNVTRYQLLISCPGDVKEEVQIIKDAVSKFNSTFTDTLDIMLQVKHWEKDAHPETGAEPQKILNKQIVDNCDAAIAIFWTRFGTPTDEYHSGSEEEIERMITSGKNVSLYFSNIPATLNSVDLEQYQKVKDYKEKFKKDKKGLYWEYSSLDEFKEMVYDHLTKQFSSRPKNEGLTDKRMPKIEVELIDVEKDTVPDEPYKYTGPGGLIRRNELSEDDIVEEIADKVTVEDIVAYNNALPSEEEVNVYNKQQKLYEDAQNNCFDFKLSISNVGASMANEIYVDLEFPDEILVYRESEYENIRAPKEVPTVPENPVRRAYEVIEKEKYKAVFGHLDAFMKAENYAAKMLGIHNMNNNLLNLSYASMPVSSLKFPFPNTTDYTVKDHKVLTLYKKDLLHTRCYESDKFSLILTSRGEFEVKYSVMCAEWEKPVKGKILIKAEYNNDK